MNGKPRTSALLIVPLFLLAWAWLASPVAAVGPRQEAETRAGLVVVHADGRAVTQCVDIGAQGVTGLRLLELSQLDLNYQSIPMGAAVCRIDGQGCTYPQDDCFCQCLSVPCFYWSYWFWGNGAWTYAQQGASARTVNPGDVDAWVWSEGTLNESADRTPPALTFADICPAPAAQPTVAAPDVATPTPSPSATATPLPTATGTETPSPTPTITPSPTHTPLPTSTPLPGAPSVDEFIADRVESEPGDPVVLSWRVSGAAEVTLLVDGVPQVVSAQGSFNVAPRQSTLYTLTARNAAGETRRELAVTVTAPTPTATVTAAVTPSSTPTAPPTATPVAPPAADAPTATAPTVPARAPEVDPADHAASSPLLAPATPAPTSTWTPTPHVGPVVVITPLARADQRGLNDSDMSRLLLLGLAVLVGLPFLFAGIVFAVWKLWRRN